MNFIKCSVCFTDSKLIVLDANQKRCVQKLLGIELEHKEGEPDLICNACVSALSEFNQFRRRIKKLRHVQRSEVNSSTPTVEVKVENEDCVSVTSSSNDQEVSNERSFEKNKRNSMDSNDANLPQTRVPIVDSIPIDVTSKETLEKEDRFDLQRKRNYSNISNDIGKGEETSIDLPEKRKRYISNDIREFARTIRNQMNVSKEQRICGVCFTICDSMKLLIQHRRAEHPEAIQYECTEPNCFEVFAEQSERSLHKAQKHPQCKTCHLRFAGPIALSRHRCRLQKFKCPKECGNRFETDEQLKKHFKQCRPGAYPCTFCKKGLSCSKSLKEHLKTCTRNRASSSVDGTKKAVVNEPLERQASSTNKMNVSPTDTKWSREFDSVATLEAHYSPQNKSSTSRMKESDRKQDAKTTISLKKEKFLHSSEIDGEETYCDFDVQIKEEKIEVIDLLAVGCDSEAEPATLPKLENETTDRTAVKPTINDELGASHRAERRNESWTRDFNARPYNVMSTQRSWRTEQSYNERRKDTSWNERVCREDRNYVHYRRGDFWKPLQSRSTYYGRITY